MVYLMVAPFLVVLADYQTALENLTLEKVMLAVVQGQLVRVRSILDLNMVYLFQFDSISVLTRNCKPKII